MSRYIVAVKLAKQKLGVTTDQVANFPGLEIVGEWDPVVVAVEADRKSMSEFRKLHGKDFLIEQPVTRSIPETPRIKLACSSLN